MPNILWVEDEYFEQKQQQWFKGRSVKVKTSFDSAEQEIKSNLNQYDVIVLDINLENSEHTENVKRHADRFGLSVREFLERSGMNLYFKLLEYGFPIERIIFLTANANETTSQINDLRQAFECEEDDSFEKILANITRGFGDDEKRKSYQFLDGPNGYDESDIEKLCNYLESYFKYLNEGQQKNTYEILRDAAISSRIEVPKAFSKGTNQLDIELKKHEANKYLVLRRSVIDGCKYLNNFIDESDEHIQFRDFVKLDNNEPCIEVTITEIKNYLDTLAQCLTIRQPIDQSHLNICYRLFLRTLSHEWEENIEAKSLKNIYGNDLSSVYDIFTFAWIMKSTRNWVSHAKLLEPLNAKFIAFLFLVNMRAMFRLPKTILPYEQALLNLVDPLPIPNIETNQVKDKIKYAEQLVDEHLASLRMGSEKHFGEKINDIHRRVTGNPDAEKYNFQQFLFQYFWINQKQQLRNLAANSDEFLPTLARYIYKSSFREA